MKTIAFLVIFHVGLLYVQAQVQTEQYRVTITETKARYAKVEAKLEVKNGRILMAPNGANHLPNGWSTFVENLEIKDENGRALPFQYAGNSIWQIANEHTGPAVLSYQVNLSFVYEKYPAGNEQAGAFFDDSIFLVNRPLFIVSDSTGHREVTFDVPANWKISTPFEPTSSPKTFVAKTQTEFISNTTALGDHAELLFNEGDFTAILVLPGTMKESAAAITTVLKKTVRAYLKLFDCTPRSRFMMTFFYADQDDGESFSRSAAFTTRNKVTPNGMILWGNFLAHELFHFWNGQQIRGEPRENREWFSEGFTEYYANLTLLREGIIGEEMFLRKIEKHLGLYLYYNWAPPFAGVSLKQAGTRKSFNRPGVYNGGWAAALCLDVLIRQTTNGVRNLDDFMRRMYEKYGLTRQAHSYEDIVATASEIAGKDLGEFFKKYVEGNETFPIAETLEKIGYEGHMKSYAGEVYINKYASLTKPQKHMQWELLRLKRK